MLTIFCCQPNGYSRIAPVSSYFTFLACYYCVLVYLQRCCNLKKRTVQAVASSTLCRLLSMPKAA